MNKNNDTREIDIEHAVNEVLQELIKSQEKAKQLVSNNKYILWLENFTVNNPGFTDDAWLYDPDGISAEDSENVQNLCSFFNGIKSYADRNFLPVYSDDVHESKVYIKFNGIGYEIGLVVGQGSFTYCKRLNVFSETRFIDFNDIVSNKKQEHVDYICEKLDSMSSIIEELLKSGVSAKTISTKVQNVLNN